VSLRDELAGAWRLLRWESHAPDGTVSSPYGDDLVGLLLLTDSGYMSGQIMLPQSEAIGPGPAVVAGPQRYIAYCGHFTFDQSTMTLTTRVEASVARTWVGTDQVRRVQLEGDRLMLRPPIRPSGEQGVLTWQRLHAPRRRRRGGS
jgi:hypothetical protein